MPNANIGVYLNDHLAGSVVALELMDHLKKSHAGTAIKDFLVNLRADVLADRAELEALMGRLKISPNARRKAMAWTTEKLAEIKLRLDDPAGGPLYLLEALEAIAALRPEIDKFFEQVMVMAENDDVRKNRLVLLAEVLREFTTIADFSEMGGEGRS